MNNSSVIDNRIAKIKTFYTSVNVSAVAALHDIYHQDIIFTDPAGTIRGLTDLRRHFERLLANTRECTCVFDDARQLVAGDAAMLFWRMQLIVPGLAGGKPFAFDGTSRLLYDGDVIIEHRDYFDLGAMLYERLPLFGALVRHLRGRLALHD